MATRELPIYEIERELLERARREARLIVQAPTGSGKSTQVPQMLLEGGLAGDGQIVILQPRRLAARLLAARVAQERGARLGGEVGYQIRFDDVSSRGTRIKFVTEGLLLRQMMVNPSLNGISVLIFDEFHERHLYGDITLARALDVQAQRRPDLKILVMSATLDAALLEPYLAPCAVLRSEGRTFPVEIRYIPQPLPPERSAVWDAAAEEWARLVRAGAPGDALIFMPGAYEISRTVAALRAQDAARDWIILPLHGELAPTDQDAAVARYNQRKTIVSTNVAETSLTIDGVRIVIDSGLARIPRYDPYRGINTLLIDDISRASADQRAGRAGRTAPGLCLRLWTAAEHRGRPVQELPEIRRLDLAETALTLKAAGVTDLNNFRWLEKPEPRALARAETLLRDLGAADPATGEITDLGRRMTAFPVHPRYARMLLAAGERGCVRSVALIAALTQGRNILLRRSAGETRADRELLLGDEAESDFFLLMRAWRYADKNRYDLDKCRRLGIHAQTARQVGPVYDYFLNLARGQGLPLEEGPPEDAAIQKCVLTGFADQLARRLDASALRCALVHNRRGTLVRDSAVRADMFVAAEVHELETRGEIVVQLSLATAVREEWLRELFPEGFNDQEKVFYDTEIKRVQTEVSRCFRDLPLETKRVDKAPLDEAAFLLAEEIARGRLTLKHWDHAVEQWILRLNFLVAQCPDLGLPALGEADCHFLYQQICHGVVSAKDAKERQVWPALREWLTPPQLALLEKHAPERLELSNGRKAKIAYDAANPPFIALRIQELFGVRDTPRIAMGRAPVTVRILAPSQRPVQITSDLAGFWRDHYPRIKQELQRKYPRHEWR